MGKRTSSQRRPRLHVDVSDAVSASVKRTADRFFRGAVSDAVVAALTAFSWMLDQKQQGKRVIAVEPDAMPERYTEASLPGVDEALVGTRWIWLIEQPHPWRRQLWIKGSRMRAAQLVGHMNGNAWSAEETARQFNLPVEALREAQRYVDDNRQLIDAETIEEQRIAQRIATAHPPEVVSAAPH